MIDVVILNYNDSDTVIDHISSIRNYKIIHKILIVDNMSTDDSYNILKKKIDTKVLLISSNRNGGYGFGNNVGIKYLVNNYNSRFILLANPDVKYTEETLKKLLEFLDKNDDFAIVAPFMLNSKGVKQFNTAFRIPNKWEYILSLGLFVQKFVKSFYYKDIESENTLIKKVGCVAGSMFLMDANKMMRVGMFDENMFLYCEEIVLGLKMKKADYNVGLLPQESFIHNHSVSINKSIKSEVKKRKILINSKLYVIKKYYSTNFADFLVAWIIAKISLFEYRIISIIKRK